MGRTKVKKEKTCVVESRRIECRKRGIIALGSVLLIILLGFFLVGKSLYSVYVDSFYPDGILNDDTFSAFSKTMSADTYKPLKDVAEALADGGNGYLLYPVDGRTKFNYEGSVMATLATENESGLLIVAQGSGNIQEDIVAHARDYYTFMGRIEPSYDEKVFESGSIDNFYTNYSSGYLNTGNFFKENGFYLSAFECRATDEGDYLFIVFVTENIMELKGQIGMMKLFATYMLEGTEVAEDAVEEVTEEETGEQSLENSSEQIEAINRYISEKYDVEAIPGTVSGNDEEVAVSDNGLVGVSDNRIEDGMGVEEITVEVMNEEQIELWIGD